MGMEHQIAALRNRHVRTFQPGQCLYEHNVDNLPPNRTYMERFEEFTGRISEAA